MNCATEYRFEIASTPEERRLPWYRMVDEGLHRIVIWNRLEPTLIDWLETVDPTSCMLVNIFWTDGQMAEHAGAFWITPVTGLSGCIHFCIFSGWQADADSMGRQALNFAFEQWPFDAFWGMTPSVFRHVFPQLRRWGFRIGDMRIPRMCNLPREKDPTHCVDAVISVVTRQDFKGGTWAV